VTRPSEVSRPESTSAMVTRSRAREDRGINVAPEAQLEPEIETRPEQEVANCEGGLGAARPSTTEAASLFTTADIPEAAVVFASKEVTASLFTAPSQASTPHIMCNRF